MLGVNNWMLVYFLLPIPSMSLGRRPAVPADSSTDSGELSAGQTGCFPASMLCWCDAKREEPWGALNTYVQFLFYFTVFFIVTLRVKMCQILKYFQELDIDENARNRVAWGLRMSVLSFLCPIHPYCTGYALPLTQLPHQGQSAPWSGYPISLHGATLCPQKRKQTTKQAIMQTTNRLNWNLQPFFRPWERSSRFFVLLT